MNERKLKKFFFNSSIISLLITIIFFSGCFSFKSTPLAPDICIKHDFKKITSGSFYDFGNIHNETSQKAMFIIENMGTAQLKLLGNPKVFLKGSNDFTINYEPSDIIEAGKSTYFIIQFTPLNSGEKIATVTIDNNDPDEGIYTFLIKGRGKNRNKFEVSHNIAVFFTDPYGECDMEEVLIEKIDLQSCEVTLDLCFYGLDRDNVITAIENAIYRGVHVRFVGNRDGNNTVASCEGEYYEGYNRIARALDTAFPVDNINRTNFPEDTGFSDFILTNKNGIMHNKFALLTDNSGNSYLYTGSTNCTDSGFMQNNNNSLIISDHGIVETYREQFEYLLDLPNTNPIDSVRQHIVDGIIFKILFSPNILDDKTPMEHLIDLIGLADNSIHFMIFSFSHEGLTNLLIDKYSDDLDVRGIYDESQLINSSEEIAVMNNIHCKIDGNNSTADGYSGKLHHKTMILDTLSLSPIVVTGSYNWSNNANIKNDENLLFIHSKEVAQIYEEEWQKIWDNGVDIENTQMGDGGEYQDIILNEIMWMGSRKKYDEKSPRDEFIELKNFTGKRINLSGWTIDGASRNGMSIVLNDCFIDPYGMLVILAKDTTDSAFRPDLYIRNNNLCISNSRIQLVLIDPYEIIIDYAGDGSKGVDFAGYNGKGDGSLKKSMARKEDPGNGDILENWITTSSQVNISNDSDFVDYNYATPGAENRSGDLGYDFLSIVISEIAWAGTSSSYFDEWFELFNNTEYDINLNGWVVGGDLNIHLTGTIPAGKHFLLERTNDDSVPNKLADIIYTGSLNNSGGILLLFYNERTIDEVRMSSGWKAGANSPKLSMERIDMNSCCESDNWQNGIGDIDGAQNSKE